jgi:hypothetical protein
LLVAKTESDLQLFGNPLWVEIDSDLPENALALIEAFMQIKDAKLRRIIVNLVDEIAG